MDRAYTVREIEALRQACENKFLFGSYAPDFEGTLHSGSYNPIEKITAVEEIVRTYMMAGLTAQDLRPTPTAQE